MNRQSIEQAVFRDFGYADSPATAVANRVRGYINDRHRRILSAPGRERLRSEIYTFSTVASQVTYALEADVARVIKLTDTTNSIVLEQRTIDWYRRAEPSPQTGTSEYWIPLRRGPALRDIATVASGGSGIWVVSTSATDGGGGAITVKVVTIDATGSLTNTTASTNGTTRVQIGTATNHLRLVEFVSSSAAVGVLELYDAAVNGNRVSYIPLDRTAGQRLQIALWPTPSAANTIQVDFIHEIRDFTQNYDEPQLPQDFHYLVALGARIDEARHKHLGDAAILQWQAELTKGLSDLDNWIVNSPDYLVIPGDLTNRHHSNLGPAFPPGVW